MKHFETEKSQKVAAIFMCESCDYHTSRKNDFVKHLATDKHRSSQSVTEKSQKVAESRQCPCGILFSNRTTLWRHKKVCTYSSQLQETAKLDKDELIISLLKQNSELLEIVKNGTGNNTNCMNNNNNKTFNLQSRVSDKYDKMVVEIMGGAGDNDLEKENKIIHNITKHIAIHKI